jgi:lipid II isoglutaminyl synthase (glutamine-hydrolysing)
VKVEGREARILLVKNPAGANEVLRTLAIEPGAHDLLGVLNDRTADGHDVSWIWDADFELLAGRVRHATCSGTRAAELALRLKYAGVDPARIEVLDDLPRALAHAVDVRRSSLVRPASAQDARAGEQREQDGSPQENSVQEDPPLYILPTYTAMLALRELLVRRGEASSSWR